MPTNNLPSQPTSFIGREKELNDLAELLDNPACRLVTLVGSGGIGKTRLAIQAACKKLGLADGVLFVSLASVTSAELVPAAIAAALETSFVGSETPHIQMIQYLREKQMLLVMDNFEHLLGAADFLSDVVGAAPDVKIVVTSRERLNLQEEWVFVLDGLVYPSEGVSDPLETYSAVQLFVQRARQVQTRFSLKDNASSVKIICQQVEGMPLGLELAASWLRMLSCEQIVAQMTSNLDFLTTPLRNVPDRHRSLRMVFEQSWRLMREDEQTVLMRLSVFRGGFDLQAAAQVTGATLPLLASLVDKSLVRVDANGRYDLHELLRQYAADKLARANGVEETNQRHIAYFIQLAEAMEAHLFSREQTEWFDKVEAEMDNFRAALARSVESEAGLRLVAALGWFFSDRSHWMEGLGWLEQILAANPDTSALMRAKALNFAGAFAGHLTDRQKLRRYCEEAIAIGRSADDKRIIAWGLSHLSVYDNSIDVLELCAQRLAESLALFRKLDDKMGLAHTLVRTSWNTIDRDDIPGARILLDEAAALTKVSGDLVVSGWVNMTIGEIAYFQGRFEEARVQFEISLEYFQEARFGDGIYACLINFADNEMKLGNFKQSQSHLKQALILNKASIGNHRRTPSILAGLGRTAQEHGEFERATRLLAAAYHTDMVYWAQQVPERYTYLRDIEAVRKQMGEDRFAKAWAIGRAMTLEQAVAYALEDKQATSSTPPAHETEALLNEREREIVTLMAAGLNSREIAARLVLSVQTVRWYVKIIYSKLDVHSRSEAIAQAKALKLLF